MTKQHIYIYNLYLCVWWPNNMMSAWYKQHLCNFQEAEEVTLLKMMCAGPGPSALLVGCFFPFREVLPPFPPFRFLSNCYNNVHVLINRFPVCMEINILVMKFRFYPFSYPISCMHDKFHRFCLHICPFVLGFGWWWDVRVRDSCGWMDLAEWSWCAWMFTLIIWNPCSL